MNEPPSAAPKPAVQPAAAGTDTAALPAGHTVLEYRIEKTLGGGGFGITYLARDVNLELPVAVKEYFPGELTARAADLSLQVRTIEAEQPFRQGLERFLDEARALASFRHPNIARVLRYFRSNGTAYIVMEYESGDPLKRWLARQPGLDQTGLLKVIYPLLDGLEAVHKLDFLHRDIKPDNIYIRADGSPVLLDFGAARRQSGGRDLTNIVSPGFAPFEQYHSKGYQGPWTDIYALGAVMYWMSTGYKPVEAASRVQNDNMPRALELADTGVFSAGLLRVIDWALSPDSARRPQDIAALRLALENTGLPPASATPATTTPPDDHPLADQNPAPADSGASTLRRNIMGTVMYLHLVGYSKHSPEQQVAVKEHFHELLTKALKGVDGSSRIVIDTGDGAAACFLGDPEEALQSALLLRGLLLQRYGKMLALRISLHLGPLRKVMGGNQQVSVIGDGMNVAQRMTDFAQPNQIVASRAFRDVMVSIADNAAGLFSAMGPHLDKHLRSHDIHAVLDPQSRPKPPVAARSTEFENTASFAALATLTPERVAEVEAELTKSIGPLARVLVQKALTRSVSAQGLRELLAVSIPDPSARELFIKPKSQQTRPAGHSGLLADVSQALQPFSRPVSSTSRPDSLRTGPSSPVDSPYFSAQLLLQLERTLSLYIGPLARLILKKEIARHHALPTLLLALAAEIDRPADREKFLAATKALQPPDQR